MDSHLKSSAEVVAGVAEPGQLNLEESPSWGSRSVECFQKLEQIGEGTYGQVYMAKEKRTGEVVALKKIRMDNEKEGFPITAIREIKLLRKLQHENVINLKEIVTSPGRDVDEQGNADNNRYKGSIYMVFEYMDHDLTGLADRPGMRFTIPQIKCYMKQLLTGLHYCHVNQVLHRDIKGSNLLIDNEGNLKLADFGLARSFSNEHNANLTNRVITLWYRPPELLLGATKYGPAVDMWSVGCIFAELLSGKAILTGKTEPDQLNKIYELCGTPDEINWPGVSKIPWYAKFKPTKPMRRRVREVFHRFDHHALDLLDKMLTLDPSQRIAANDALSAEYFWADPLPCDPRSLPKYESSHEFQTKKKRQEQRQNEEIAKRQKLPYPRQHARLPPIQHPGQGQGRGQGHPTQQQWAPMGIGRPPVPSGPSHHHYGNQQLVPPANGYPSGGFYPDHAANYGSFPPQPYLPPSNGSYPPPPPPPPPPAGAGVGAGAGYGMPPNYAPTNQYGGPNMMPSNRNQQYGWQQ